MRAVTAAVEAALAAGTARPVIAIEIQHDSGYLRMSTFNRDIDWNGATFLGNSYILSVQAQTETSDLANSGMTVEVKGGSDVRSLVLGGMTGRLTARAYLMLLDSNEDLLDDPIVMFSGYYDFATIDYAPDQCVVTFNFEDEMSDFKRARDYRWTTESQKLFDVTDTGFRYVPSLQDWSALWGRPKSEKSKKPAKKKHPK